jgi:hypothetical protein
MLIKECFVPLFVGRLGVVLKFTEICGCFDRMTVFGDVCLMSGKGNISGKCPTDISKEASRVCE